MLREHKTTFALVAASAAVYAAVNFFSYEHVTRHLMISAYTWPVLPEIRGGQWWRLFTPALLHFGLFHLVFNLLWVWELGRVIELRHGGFALFTATLMFAAASNLAQYFAAGPGFGGMSGVLYGYFGYLWAQGKFNPAFGLRLPKQIVYLLFGWFAVCWSGVLTLIGVHVANAAHTAGLLAGVALAVVVMFAATLFARAR